MSYFHIIIDEKLTYGKTLRHLLIFKQNIFFSEQMILKEIGSYNDGIPNCIKQKDALQMPLKTKSPDSQGKSKTVNTNSFPSLVLFVC